MSTLKGSEDGPMSSNDGTFNDEDDLSTIRDRRRSESGSTWGADAEEDDDDGESLPAGEHSYSSHMEEIFSDEGASEGENGLDDEEEEFIYDGKDAEVPTGGYHEQLKDVLDGDSEGDSVDEAFNQTFESEKSVHGLDQSLNGFDMPSITPVSDHTPSTSSVPLSSASPARMESPLPAGTTRKDIRPFLHPSISRLRSGMPSSPQHRISSFSSLGTSPLPSYDLNTPTSSRLSSVSRTSSVSNLNGLYASGSGSKDERNRDAFRWTTLRTVGEHVFAKSPEKANSVLGAPVLGSPTVLAANGMICIGTDAGRVFVFDFKQHLRCICGDENPARSFGPVTALALSHDHTFVAVGHAFGHIQLFDFNHPHSPARSVPTTTLASVSTGRQEGHIFGSRIVALGFIAGRHTAFVSADDQGLAFYHSLGKVLFMDANDCLRILGKYPEEDIIPPGMSISRTTSASTNGSSTNGTVTPHAGPQPRPRKAGTILSMGPLPLGTSPHPTDTYQLVAMLTPIKLVIIGLKPSPKTWFRRHREGEDGNSKKSKWRGCLAWFPSVATVDPAGLEKPKEVKKKGQKDATPLTDPLLAFSWGQTLTVVRITESKVSQRIQNKKTGKVEKVEVGKVHFDDHGIYTHRSDILALQWLNVNQLVLFTDNAVDVLDIRSFKIVEGDSYDARNLISPTLNYTLSGAIAYQDSVRDVQHSVRTYKGKVFLLEYKEVKVATLLTWADRILSSVQDGDFLSAINLTREYYLGQAKGNRNGLPEDAEAMRKVVSEKMSELMIASARYAFSEDRFTDSTHVTPDNRGVDRTSLFEGLVSTCARACIALDDYDFLFEDLFQYYDNSGISSIFLRQLEPFILDNTIHYVPPRITQRLIALHEDDNNLEDAERIIWHIDPDCLDINQAITLCQSYHLYDALVYVYNSALRDYVTPVVEFIQVIRKVQQDRNDPSLMLEEHSVVNAYKVFPYLEDVLSGLSYPGKVPMDPEDSVRAQNDVYDFLFYGRSKVWPVGSGGKLILTSIEEGGAEPTYPYARLLLCFDAEAFLHVLDIAFEQSYLNDESQGMSRQIIIKILLEIVATSKTTLSPTDITFVNIFVARNVPKYPQFIHIAPSSLQDLLVGLATDLDLSTREDRQLAAEFLLSAYTPHDSETILRLFEDAGFYRILRSWYRQDRQWSALLQTYLHDPDMDSEELFANAEETLLQASKANSNALPQEILDIVLESLPQFLLSSIPRTALLVDKYAPESHIKVVESLENDSELKQFAYLRCLLGPPSPTEDGMSYTRAGGPSLAVNTSLRKLYLKLLCRLEPTGVLKGIEYLREGFLEMHDMVRICEETRTYDAVVWLLNKVNPVESLSKLESFSRILTADVGELLVRPEEPAVSSDEFQSLILNYESLIRMGISICLDRSRQTAEADVPLEDLWFTLLRSQLDAVQMISFVRGDETPSYLKESVIASLRSLVHDSFTSLVTVSSTKAVSFPRLFKRLVDSTARLRGQAATHYSEFRNILTGMLDSYRSENDLLCISKRVIEGDFFDTFGQLEKERCRGWAPTSNKCAVCRKQIALSLSILPGAVQDSEPTPQSFTISRTGHIYHSTCFPSTQTQA